MNKDDMKAAILNRLQMINGLKLGEMTPEQVTQEAPAGAPGGAPMPVDPATGQPMDPAAAAAPPPPPPTIEELLASGDPIVKLLVDLDAKCSAIMEATKAIMDAGQMQVPASSVLEAKATGPAAAPEPAKTAMSPNLVDDDDPDMDDTTPDIELASPSPEMGTLDELEPGLKFAEEPSLSLGNASMPGDSAYKTAPTRMVSTTQRNRSVAETLRNRRVRP